MRAYGPMVTNIVLIAWHWGDWPTVTALAIVATVLTLTNLWLINWYARRHSRVAADWFRMLTSAAGICVGGYYTGWSPLDGPSCRTTCSGSTGWTVGSILRLASI